jgi:hypothetical protein
MSNDDDDDVDDTAAASSLLAEKIAVLGKVMVVALHQTGVSRACMMNLSCLVILFFHLPQSHHDYNACIIISFISTCRHILRREHSEKTSYYNKCRWWRKERRR